MQDRQGTILPTTIFLLFAEYGTGHIPLERCAHVFGLAFHEARRRAARQTLPVPVFRSSSQKSPWLVDAVALAQFLDAQKEKATLEWVRIHGSAP